MKKETKEKIAKTLKEKYATKELTPHMSGAHSLESRKKQANTKTGKHLSKEHKTNISQGLSNSTIFKESFNEDRVTKTKQTNIKKYGVQNVAQCEKIKEKIKDTNIKKYGNASALNGSVQIKKKQETWNDKYGVDNPMQNEEIFFKAQLTGFKAKKFKNTDIYYRGSYELDFLEKYYDYYNDIKNGPPVKYVYKGKSKIYFPDFYIPSLNLIIEIKSSYYYNKYRNICDAKKHACISMNYKYMLIIDKNYKFFDLGQPNI